VLRNTVSDNDNEVELCLEAYYGLIEDCNEFPEWTRKIEEEIG
jgi:hypothetical protein